MLIAIAATQAALFAYIGFKDYRTGLIPNKAVLPGLLFAAIVAFLPGQIGFIAAWQGFIITAVISIILWKIGVLAAGDAKLIMLVGLTLGFPMLVAGIGGGFMVGAVVIIGFIIRDGVVTAWFKGDQEMLTKRKYPLAPFIAISAITVLAWRVFVISLG